MNAFRFNRDIRRPIDEIRLSERSMPDKGRACNTVSLPELVKARVAICFATCLARIAQVPGDQTGFNGQEICHGVAMGQLAYYEVLAREGHLRILKDWPAVASHMDAWRQAQSGEEPPPGIIMAMEGADPITSPDEMPMWWEKGLRVISLCHYGTGVYAYGTGTEGGLRGNARSLLRAMRRTGMILDVVHLADQAYWEALEEFDGPILGSHGNCRALVPGQRQLNDEQLKALIERKGVLGLALDMWMLQPGWIQHIAFNEKKVDLKAYVDHIDYICQLAGNADHVAVGSDLDGGYGAEQTPFGFDTISDLQQLPTLLAERGYKETDIAKIMHGNWLRLLKDAWTGDN